MTQKRWYYIDSSLEKIGPVTSRALKVLADQGIINRETTLLSEDGLRVFEAGSVKGLFPEDEEIFQSGVIEQASWAVPKPPAPPTMPLESGIMYPQEFPEIESMGRSLAPPPDSTRLIVVLCTTIAIAFICLLGIVALRSLASSGVLTGARISARPLRSDESGAPPLQASSPKSSPSANPFIEEETLSEPSVPSKGFSLGSSKDSSDWKTKVSNFSFDLEEEPTDRSNGLQSGDTTENKPFFGGGNDSANLASRDLRQPRSTEEIIAEVEDSIALVHGENSSGTGFVVLPGIIATNSHVINAEEIESLNVVFPSALDEKKGPFKPKLLYEDPERDLAFLQIPSKRHLVLPTVKDYTFRRAQKVIAIGNPGRGDGEILENAVCEGILSTQTEIDDQPYYQLSIAVNVGNSGGPVLNDRGEVLGVVTLKATKTEAMAYCCPPDALNEAMEQVRAGDIETTRRHNEKHDSRIHFNRGMDKLRMANQVPPAKLRPFAQEGVRDFDEAITRDADHGMAYFGRGIFKAVLGDAEGAASDLDQAVRCEPGNKELAQLRDQVRTEIERQQHLRAQGSSIARMIVPTLPGDSPSGRMPHNPHEAALREFRYQQIMEKEEWTFNGRPFYAKLVGVKDNFKDGIVQFRLRESNETVDRYASRFSHEDIDDIRFYVLYHGLPLDKLRRR